MDVKEKDKRKKAIPPVCLWRAIASFFSNGTMIIGKAIGIRPIVPMAATLPFTQGRVVKGWCFPLKSASFLLPFTLFLLPASPTWANSSQVGTSGAAFLKIGPGARPEGMGEAFTGVADDVDAIYWNPAGLATLKGPEVTAMHMQWFQSVQYEYAAFAYPTSRYGTWGFAVTDLHTDNIDQRTDDTDSAIGQFGASEGAYWLSYAYPVNDRLSFGGNFKYIRQILDTTNSNAYAGDGSMLYRLPWRQARLGATIQNVGTRVRFMNESDPLPLTYRLGISLRPFENGFLLSSDIVLPRDNTPGSDWGAEYRYAVHEGFILSARTGYNTGSDVTGLHGVSAGGGLEVGRFSFDFAWTPYGDLGNTYRYAIHIKFGSGESEKHASPPESSSEPQLDLEK